MRQKFTRAERCGLLKHERHKIESALREWRGGTNYRSAMYNVTRDTIMVKHMWLPGNMVLIIDRHALNTGGQFIVGLRDPATGQLEAFGSIPLGDTKIKTVRETIIEHIESLDITKSDHVDRLYRYMDDPAAVKYKTVAAAIEKKFKKLEALCN